MKKRTVPVTLLTCLALAVAPASAEPIRFNRDIRPIFAQHCFKCHGSDLQKAGLSLLKPASATARLKSGQAAIVPGSSDKSELIARITMTEGSERMPPKGDRLPAEQVAKLKAWIDQGAVYEQHWAYVKPVRQPPPTVRQASWVRNPIDAHVLARLEKEGLSPAPEADRAVLLRRVSLDLTGLPPTPQEVAAFLRDPRPDAYEKAVERLLASPAYGEHQARFWLDQARYADTNGYEKDGRRTIWPYRDWVIAAFNRDLSFEQFTVEQIAGDLLPHATAEQKIATGFHRNTMVNTEGGVDDEEFRVAAVVDRVNTTFEIWMGTTLGCAQCHNHKYDPFSMKDYYGVFALFNSTADQGRSNAPEVPASSPLIRERQDQLRDEIARLEKARWPLSLPLGLAGMQPLKQRLADLKGQQLTKPITSLVMQELPIRRKTRIMIRGNFRNLGEEVKPGVPAALHPLPPKAPLNRLGLARWLVDQGNPLVGRVLMNRIWARTFGKGLVETSEEFGVQGEPPTHPELLDFLATELLERKWSLKAMHRLLVTSAAYRQSSRVSADLVRRDPYNRLLARGPRFRLDAEMVRDNALAISGLLVQRLGGPSVFPYQPEGIWANPYSGDKWVMSPAGDQYRRGLYTFWRRTAPYAAFMAFDAPSREVVCERRPRTNTPLQALATLNDRVFIEASAALARRIIAESKGDRDRLIRGFRLCVARTPTEQELELLGRLYAENLEKYRKDSVAARAMAKHGKEVAVGVDVAELAAWTVVANVLLNLDETITKG